jgi:hypothetical protein
MEPNLREPETPIEWARHYAERGHPVFPLYEMATDGDGTLRCSCGKLDCRDAGKHPRTAHGFHDATTDLEQIRRWWERWPNANIGLRTGDGLLVLDVDVDKGGDQSLEMLEHRYGKLPVTRQALTGSGGQHRWFQLPAGVKVGCSSGFEDGLDVRADGGYVVVEPSIHRTGNIYRWDGIAGFDEPMADVPAWLLNILTARRDKAGTGEGWRQIEIQVNRHPELPPELLQYIEADNDLASLFNLRRADLADGNTGQPNFSAYDLALASRFLEAGFTYQQVADVLTAFRLKHGNPKGKGYRLDYLQRTIWLAAQASASSDRPTDAVEAENAESGLAAGSPGAPDPDPNAPASSDRAAESNPESTARRPGAGNSDSSEGTGVPGKAEAKQGTEEAHVQVQKYPYRQIRGCLVRIKKGRDDSEEFIPLTNFSARIASDISEDDGVEVKRFFKISAMVGPRSYSFIVPATEFASMDWPIESIGPQAIVHPNQKDWARAAIQCLSTNIEPSRIYTHTGWRKVNGSMLYLHGDGAIGSNGAVPNVDVRLSGALAHYKLLLPENRGQLVKAVRASLRVLDVAPDDVTFPAVAGTYRAPLKSCDFTVWLAGPTGVFKSELAALAQQHYGADMNARRLPANFGSTGNALEMVAFSTKDALIVIDDFAPHGGVQEIARYHAAAERVLRSAGNNQGRGRLSSDAKLRDAKPPRGLILATGEDMPRGQSIRGRTFMVEVAPGDVNTTVLTECQLSAADGMYARSMGGFVQWLAGHYEEIQARLQARVLELRSQATKVHSRTPGLVAELQAGFELFLEFSLTAEAITEEKKVAFGTRCWAALNKVAKAQRVQQDASEPASRFLDLLRAAIVSGQAHAAGMDGAAPAGDGMWGWQLVGSSDHERLVSRGKCVGWVDGASLYLEPTASFSVAQDLGRSTGEPLTVGQTTLKKRLKEKGLLVSTDLARETLTIRRKICGETFSVLHLRADALAAQDAKTDAKNTSTTEVFTW